jgi:hypothetical protein
MTKTHKKEYMDKYIKTQKEIERRKRYQKEYTSSEEYKKRKREYANKRYHIVREKMLAVQREYYAKNRKGEIGRDYRRNKDYKRNYGITLDEFNCMLEKQNGLCSCCGVKMVFRDKVDCTFPCLDHNHKTGKIRAIICSACNLTIGISKESVDRLRACIKYLCSHNATV